MGYACNFAAYLENEMFDKLLDANNFSALLTAIEKHPIAMAVLFAFALLGLVGIHLWKRK